MELLMVCLMGTIMISNDSGNGTITIELTESEANDIEELASLGADKSLALQYYKACNGNKEMAANMILNDMIGGNNVEPLGYYDYPIFLKQ